MNWTVKEIRKALGGKLIGNMHARHMVCTTIMLLPDELITQIVKKVWFISSPEDAWAFTFRGSDIQDRHLIFISDELLQQDESQIRFTIMHEIGHVVLNHRNSIGASQTQSEIRQQELAADRFANQYLAD